MENDQKRIQENETEYPKNFLVEEEEAVILPLWISKVDQIMMKRRNSGIRQQVTMRLTLSGFVISQGIFYKLSAMKS